MFDRHEVVFIFITLTDDSVAVMQFITRAWSSKDDTNVYEREATPEAIDAEIAKSQLPVKSWRVGDLADLPKDRGDRNAWRDDGTRIAVDAEVAAATVKPRDLAAELDALKTSTASRLDAIEAGSLNALSGKTLSR